MRLFHHLDSCVCIFATIITSAGAVIADVVTSPGKEAQTQELLLLLVPLIGAMIFSGGMILLNPTVETRRIIIGRAFIALAIGGALPSVLCVVHPDLTQILVHPGALFLFGGIVAAIVYAVSKPFATRLYERSGSLACQLEQQLEKKLPVSLPPAVAVNPNPSASAPP